MYVKYWGVYFWQHFKIQLYQTSLLMELVINTAVSSILRHLPRHIPEHLHTLLAKIQSIASKQQYKGLSLCSKKRSASLHQWNIRETIVKSWVFLGKPPFFPQESLFPRLRPHGFPWDFGLGYSQELPQRSAHCGHHGQRVARCNSHAQTYHMGARNHSSSLNIIRRHQTSSNVIKHH